MQCCRHEGLLVVKIIEARGLHKAELVGKADPLVTVWTQHMYKQSTVRLLACCTAVRHGCVQAVMERPAGPQLQAAALALPASLLSLQQQAFLRTSGKLPG